jgi:hypothetical protein
MSKVYKLRSEEVEDVKETLMKFVVEKINDERNRRNSRSN